jgi:endo-1,4-beta-mannosidase
MSLPRVKLDKTYFQRDKRAFLPVGAHWVPAEAALDWPVRWDPVSIAADFAKMRDLGFNTVRFDLFWAWFEPHPGSYNPEAFAQLDYLIELAHRYEIYLHPTMFIGGEVGEAYWDVPWRHGRHPHADPELLRLQTDHAAELARRYRGEPSILAWDLTDEPPYWIAGGQTTDAMAINWTRLLAWAVRRADPEVALCVGTAVEDVSHGPFRPDTIAAEVDFLSAHPYAIYLPDLFPDPMLSERGTYCGAFQVRLSAGAGKPVMIHELGASAAQYTPERIAAFDRTTLYSSLGAGSNGFLLWCYTDAAPGTFQRAPYLRAPHETQFGLTTWDRQDRPAGAMLRQFSRIVERMDLTGIEPEPTLAALIVPHEWAKPHGDFSRLGIEGASPIPYVSTQDGGALAGNAPRSDWDDNLWLTGAWLSAFILSRRAGITVSMRREYTPWQEHPLALLPSPLTSTEHNLVHVHTRFWEEARSYVEGGGALYASLCADAAIPEMADLFGARLSDHAMVDEVVLKVVNKFGDLKEGDEFRLALPSGGMRYMPAVLEMAGGEIVAVDSEGRPVLVAHTFGAGKTLLCAYPLETILAATPAAFERPNEVHRLYRALRQWAGIAPGFETDHPTVEVGTLLCEDRKRGYAVLTNHSSEDRLVTVTTTLPLASAVRITPDGEEALELSDRRFQVQVPAWDGAIIKIM